MAWGFLVVASDSGNFSPLPILLRSAHAEGMYLNDEALAEFRAIWEEEHPGETLSDEELHEIAVRVLRAVEAVYLPIPLEAPRGSALDAGDSDSDES